MPSEGHIVGVLLQISSGARHLVEENPLWLVVTRPARIRIDVRLHVCFVPRTVYAIGSGRYIPQYEAIVPPEKRNAALVGRTRLAALCTGAARGVDNNGEQHLWERRHADRFGKVSMDVK